MLLCLIIHSTEGWSPFPWSNQIATNAKIVLGLAQVCCIPSSHIPTLLGPFLPFDFTAHDCVLWHLS